MVRVSDGTWNGEKILPKMEKGRKLGRRYPWTEWFSRPKFTINRGDYLCMPHAMAQMVRNKAHALGVRPHIAIHETGRIDVVLEKAHA